MCIVLGNLECFQILIDYKADIDFPNHLNQTPLSVACNFGRVKFVKKLLECGACVNVADNFKMTALDTAIDVSLDLNFRIK